jgi:hypothetical protein
MKKEKALKRLGYTEEWLEYGIITEKLLFVQYAEILISDDDNAEHYRCKGFQQFLHKKECLTDTEVERIFQLQDNGPDHCDLYENRILTLLYSDLLSDEQLANIAERPGVQERPIQKIYLRAILLRKIKHQGLVEEVFEDIKSTNDSAIHDFILNRADLTRQHAEWLQEHGLTKRVRNISK